MRAFLFGLVLGLLIVPAGVYYYFASGSVPTASSAEAMPFEKVLARQALHARMEKEAPKSVGLQWDEANLTGGAEIYVKHCAVCHGLPGQEATPIAKGMYPKPPALTEGKGVTDDPPQESYWKVSNGMRLTGMPAFKGSLSDTQIWQVSLFVANADKLPPAAKQVLLRPLATSAPVGMSGTPTTK